MLNMPRLVKTFTLLAALALMVPNANSETYPNRLVRIVTANAGGGNDLAARIIYQPLSKALGQSVIVENRGGGQGENTVRALLSQPPDGYTMMVYSSGIWIAPLIQKVSWNPVKDFAPIVMLAKAPGVLAVHPSLPVRSVKELIALAKARPGDLNYASGQNGASTHLSAELLKSMAGIDMVRIIYNGTGAGIVSVASGECQVIFASVGSIAPFIKSGKVRPLAVTSKEPSSLLPDLPTINATALPGFESEASYGVFAAAGTPVSIINRLNKEIVKVLSTPEIKERFRRSGVEVVGGSPEAFGATIKADIKKWRKVIEEADIGTR